jgi:hypothetical protein
LWRWMGYPTTKSQHNLDCPVEQQVGSGCAVSECSFSSTLSAHVILTERPPVRRRKNDSPI